MASARSLPPSPTGALPDSDGLTHLGRVAQVGRTQGAEGLEEAGRPFPQSQAGGVARAQVKPIPASPGNARRRDARRGALQPAALSHPGCVRGPSRGASPPRDPQPFGALGAASRAGVCG